MMISNNYLALCIGVSLLVVSITTSLELTKLISMIILAEINSYHASGSDEKGRIDYHSEDNANIVRVVEGNNVHIHADPQNKQDTKSELGREEYDDQQKQLQQCPSIVRNKAGLFDREKSDSPLKDDFDDTILLVSSNYAYYNMLQNWEFLANELNLQWAVLALDDKLYDELGPSRAIPPDEKFSVSGGQSFRKGNFNGLSCNKIRMALQVAHNCEVDVVFSDADNIFFKNPFEHDLGRLIKSKKYDYLYQPNDPARHPRADRCLRGRPRREANTGFYYFSHKSEIYKSIAESTLERCLDQGNTLDDQSLFWREFWKIKEQLTSNGNDETHNRSGIDFNHCRLEEYENSTSVISDENTFNFCCVDPFYYPTGGHDARSGPSNNDPITYHSNYAHSYGQKVEKLVYARSDGHGWNMSRFEDGIGGLLN
mmetsp:Transcript_14738/g.41064  ORF Transcript_14738/g.41064 Transcript_14738/m.41064 type:complete len:427 (+) Transcript_14738:91-1371(+)